VPHSWKAYETAKNIADRLLVANCIKKKDYDMVRGIIQITLEEVLNA